MEGETHGTETQSLEQGSSPQASGQQAPQEQGLETDHVEESAEWQARLDAKDAEMADMKVGYELRLAGARNVKAAKALLGEYEGDITKLKAAEPWLFVPEQMVGANGAGSPGAGANGAAISANKPQGKTGLPNQGAALDEGKELKRWREIAGLTD